MKFDASGEPRKISAIAKLTSSHDGTVLINSCGGGGRLVTKAHYKGHKVSAY